MSLDEAPLAKLETIVPGPMTDERVSDFPVGKLVAARIPRSMRWFSPF
jgi:hypothetical protein